MHFARTRLLALENTIGGRVLGAGYMQAATSLAHARGLATHLDGARICNAAVKLGIGLREAAAGFDTVSVCLSKGLGSPVGSVLCGPKAFIEQGKRWRKMLGGGMRQAGILAAAGLYALEHNVPRLADDHAHARRLAEGLQGLAGVRVEAPQSNMVFVELAPERAGAVERLRARGLLCTGLYQLRLVTHLDVSADDVERAIRILRECL
jgi:threonine aldolase